MQTIVLRRARYHNIIQRFHAKSSTCMLKFKSTKHFILRTILGSLLITPSAVYAEPLAQTFPPTQDRATIGKITCSASAVRLGIDGKNFISSQIDSFDVEASGLYQMIGSLFGLISWPEHGLVKQVTGFDINLRSLAFRDANNLVGSDSLQGLRFYSRGSDGVWTMVYRAGNPMKRNSEGLFARLKVASMDGVDIRKVGTGDEPKGSVMTGRWAGSKSHFEFSNTFDGRVSMTLVGRELFTIGSRYGVDLKVFEGSTVSEIDSRVDRFGFGNLSFAKLSGGQSVLWDRGVIAPLTSDNKYEALESLPLYAMPILDASGQMFSMVHGPTKVVALNPEDDMTAAGLQFEVDKWVEKGWYLKSASIDASSGRSILLFKAGSLGDVAFSFVDSSRSDTYRMNCKTTGGKHLSQSVVRNKDIPSPKIPVTYREVGAGPQRLAAWTFKPQRTAEGRVISLRGGPNINLMEPLLRPDEQKVLEAGFEIVKYEYSGARQVNPDVYSRLRRDGNALRSDAELIRVDQTEQQKSPNLIISANSFGAQLASFLAEEMGTDVSRIVLAVPYGEYLQPETYAPMNDPQWSVRQRELEAATRGIPITGSASKYAEAVAARRKVLCKQKNLIIVFAASDPAIDQTGWRQDCTGTGTRILEIDGGHDQNEKLGKEITKAIMFPNSFQARLSE